MARKSNITKSPEWAKHLRPAGKKMFWKRERKNIKKNILMER